MRKFFEGHSLLGVTLILSPFLFALFLRFYQLDSQSPWTDELATWWYAGHLGEVFRDETHSPLYYSILNVFFGDSPTISQLRYFSATLSVVHLMESFYLGQKVFKRNAFLIFWILLCLSPLDIIYARMARHYAWFLEGTIVFYLLWKWDRYRWLKYFVAVFMTFVHVFFLFPLSVLTLWRYWEKKDLKDLGWSALSGSLVLLFYLVKYLQFGGSAFVRNISWNFAGDSEFYARLAMQFAGDSSPRNIFYPVDFWVAGLVFLLSLCLIGYKLKSSGKIFILSLLLAVVSVELLGFWINFRVNRYFIYLVSLWIIAIAEALEDSSDKIPALILGLNLFLLVWVNPMNDFPWDREKVEVWREFEARHPVSQKVECALSYQAAYFRLNSTESCEKQLGKIDPRLPLLYFDLNGAFIHYSLQLMEFMKVTDYRQLSRGQVIRFDPKDKSDVKK